jgi:triacylglycerol esterase/lipase EstA (alpha/beta hydrolase family)
MYRGNPYYDALEAKYIAQIKEAQAVLQTYFQNSVGIGEHSDILPEFDKWIEQLASAEEKLQALRNLLKR